MSWQDREYSQQQWAGRGSGRPGLRWPSRGAGVLILLHVAAYVFLLVMGEEEGGEALAGMLALSPDSAHPLAILFHPLATRDILTLIITVVILWWLAGRIEQQHGAGRMVGLYVLGNLLAGVAVFAVARLWPPLVGVELDSPTGAFAAWCVAAYRVTSDEMVMLFGGLRRVSRVVAIGAAVAIGLLLALRGLAAVGWLVALVAGGLAEPALRRVPALSSLPRRRRRPVVRPTVPREPPHATPPPEDLAIDEILAKISRSGLDSLTAEERARLEAARQSKLRESQDANATP